MASKPKEPKPQRPWRSSATAAKVPKPPGQPYGCKRYGTQVTEVHKSPSGDKNSATRASSLKMFLFFKKNLRTSSASTADGTNVHVFISPNIHPLRQTRARVFKLSNILRRLLKMMSSYRKINRYADLPKHMSKMFNNLRYRIARRLI